MGGFEKQERKKRKGKEKEKEGKEEREEKRSVKSKARKQNAKIIFFSFFLHLKNLRADLENHKSAIKNRGEVGVGD